MNKIMRVIGKKGRITIPYDIRLALDIRTGDILSFTTEGKTIIITKEKLCDNCKAQMESLGLFVESLAQEEREKLMRILMRYKRMGKHV